MKFKIRWTKKDLEKNFYDRNDCPVFSVLKKAGVPVTRVGGYDLSINNVQIDFPKNLEKVHNFLTDVMNNFESRKKLLGKKMTVEFPDSCFTVLSDG